jgi:hypothetical protein
MGMEITRKKAIQVVARLSNQGAGFDDWWVDMMEELELYDEKTDTWPSIFDVFEALGVTRQECKEARI